ncbi:hypothetical protein HDE_08674 [Halotydeus destructor]|nr:hypothetical protein HDE_08674 [Halotydeus destructor]
MGDRTPPRARRSLDSTDVDSSKRQAMTGPLLHVTFNREEPTYYQERLRRNVQTRVYTIQHDLYAQSDLIAIEGELNKAYEDMLKPLLTGASEDDIISVRIEHTDFDRGSFYINPMKKSAITFHELIWE